MGPWSAHRSWGHFCLGKMVFQMIQHHWFAKDKYTVIIYIYKCIHIYIYMYIHHYISLHHHFPLAKRKFFLGTLGSGRGVARGLPTSRSHRGECQGGIMPWEMPWFNHFLEIFWRFFEIFRATDLVSPGQPALRARWIWRFFGEPLPSQEAVAVVASRCHLLRAASRNSEPPDRGERKLLPWPRRCDMNWYD
jgi:hypothetical protein